MTNGEQGHAQGASSDAAPLDLWNRIQEATDVVRERLSVDQVDILCVLGSGLGGVVDALHDQ